MIGDGRAYRRLGPLRVGGRCGSNGTGWEALAYLGTGRWGLLFGLGWDDDMPLRARPQRREERYTKWHASGFGTRVVMRSFSLLGLFAAVFRSDGLVERGLGAPS